MKRNVIKYRICLDDLKNESLNCIQVNKNYLKVKMCLELVTIIVLLPLIIIIGIIAAIAIKLESSGPVFFVQMRPGKNNVPFKMFKFRSMKVGSDRIQMLTAGQDDRITKVGKFIRKYRIDELPQLWNVFLGQMSLIGPRPEPLFLSKEIESTIPFYSYRRLIAPGITGLAQVELGYTESIESVTDKLGYDLYYIRNLSILIDLFILCKTVWVVISGQGSR